VIYFVKFSQKKTGAQHSCMAVLALSYGEKGAAANIEMRETGIFRLPTCWPLWYNARKSE
jgi:uncharacterized RmlC-like cupin family protein